MTKQWDPSKRWRVGRNGLYYPLKPMPQIKLWVYRNGRLELAR